MNLVDQFLLRLLLVFLQLAILLHARQSKGDDTALVQAALDNPDRFGVVTLGPGTYECQPLRWNPSIKYLFGSPSERTTLRLAPNRGKQDRLLLIDGAYNVTVAHLNYDGNRENQNVGHDTSGQQAFIFVTEAKVHAYDIDCKNSAGDFCYVYHTGQLDIHDFTARDVFRCGVGITGKNSRTHVHHGTFTDCGIDIEPNSDGHAVDVLVEDVYLDKFDVGMKTGASRCVCRRVTQRKGLTWYLYCAPGARFECYDSSFVAPADTRFKVRLAGVSLFERCKFSNPTATRYGNLLNLVWTDGNVKTDQTFTLKDCTFTGPASEGINIGPDELANRNTLRFENVAINGSDKFIVYQKGKKTTVVASGCTDDGVAVNP